MTENLRFYTATWNVADSEPPADLTDLLRLNAKVLPDLYAIGFQEIKAGAGDLMSDVVFDDPWCTAFTDVLTKKNYVRVKSIKLVGLSLLVFVIRPALQYVTNIESEYARTGFRGLHGNKGGVSVRMDIYGVDVCFVNCHLAAHLGNVTGRILDYTQILDEMSFRDEDVNSILDHDYIFWMGDLNFRLDNIPNAEVKKRIEANDYSHLLHQDQLKSLMKEEVVFVDFEEGPINFAPTYKFDPETDIYDTSEKQRKPAWCDRILWMVHEDTFEGTELGVEQLHYTSHPSYKNSDHKPVTAEFNVKVLKYPPELPVWFEPMETWCSSKNGVCTYAVSADLDINAWDWIGLYKADYKHPLDYITYVWASTKGEDLEGSTMHTLQFDEGYLKDLVGSYCLCYYSYNKNCVVGYSEMFRITLSDEETSSSESSSDEEGGATGSALRKRRH